MNIKEHIEAGHYPKDEKGRALVPMKNGQIVTILGTDHGEPYEIVASRPDPCGGTQNCLSVHQANGRLSRLGTEPKDLMPPPPRKVKVTRWALMYTPLSKNHCHSTFDSEAAALREMGHFTGGVVIVPLAGEYEEPWS